MMYSGARVGPAKQGKTKNKHALFCSYLMVFPVLFSSLNMALQSRKKGDEARHKIGCFALIRWYALFCFYQMVDLSAEGGAAKEGKSGRSRK